MTLNSLQRQFLSRSLDPANKADFDRWRMDLERMLDDIVGGMNSVGTRLTLVWDKTVTGSAVTSITTNGEVTLDGLAHGGYFFEFVWECAALNTTMRLYYNNDTTNANYYYQGTNDAILGSPSMSYANGTIIFSGHIGISQGGLVLTSSQYVNTGNGNGGVTYHQKTASLTNLTRLDLVCGSAGGIAVNSRCRLWRRK